MKEKLLAFLAVMMIGSGSALADSVTVSNNNATLKFTRDDTGTNLGNPGDPLQLPRTLEWNVDGRRILVYPSGPSALLDLGHLHPDAHVESSQMHAQGPMLGYATGAMSGTVTGGIVYGVEGGASRSGISRLWEKVDILNKSGSVVSLSLTGLRFKPTQTKLEVPDLAGLNLVGTTVIFYQGNTRETSIVTPPFGPLTVLPVVSFAGFNPLFNQSFSLPDGATLTMITELKVAPTGTAEIINPFGVEPLNPRP